MPVTDTPNARRVRALRARTGLNQEPFARLIGASYRSVQRWEAGATEPRAYQVRAMCEACEITEAEFVELDEPAPGSVVGSAAPRFTTSDMLEVLIEALNNARAGQNVWDGVTERRRQREATA